MLLLGCIVFLGAGCVAKPEPPVLQPYDPSNQKQEQSGLPRSADKGQSQAADTNGTVSLPAKTRYMPTPGTSWQWQLEGDINMAYDVMVYDIDLFETDQGTIDALHAKNRKVICYFSAGTFEQWRPDANLFPRAQIGNPLEDWPGEKWLDVSQYQAFQDIMTARLDLAVRKKCDGVEPDNVDAYQNDSGFDLSPKDQLVFNRWLAKEAHARGLSIGLKNDLDQIVDLVSDFDFAVNEQCFQYEECGELLPFIDQNKAVFGVEYELETDAFCAEANRLGFSWLKMAYELDGGRTACR